MGPTSIHPWVPTSVVVVNGVLPVVLFALAGVLIGGAWSLRRQGAPVKAVAFVVLVALVATAGGVLWLVPGDA